MPETRDYDLILFGATGFTGQLVADYLQTHYGSSSLRWAIAGRDKARLEALSQELGLDDKVGCIVADSTESGSLKAMTMDTRVVLTTVGPYQLYGEPLLAACTETATDYVDLCGEPAWMRKMIDTYEADAKASGARIVFSCGFDSIPFDLGVWLLQQEAKRRFGAALTRVMGRVRKMKGTFSGGTAASLKATLAAAAKDPSVMDTLRNPFALAPGFEGPAQPLANKPAYDETLGSWAAPFIMAPINTRNIHRSNFLLDQAYGADFVYDEMILTGPGEQGEQIAHKVAGDKSLASDKAPKPGEGPSKEEREAGHFDILFLGQAPEGQMLKVAVTGDKDPGYGCTSKMISEAALCLIQDRTDLPGGIYTPAPAFGQSLIDRLRAKAGMTFEVEA